MSKIFLPYALALTLGVFALSGCGFLKPRPADSVDKELNQAEWLIDHGDFQEAYRHLNQALDLTPNDPEVHLNLGWLYLYTDQPQKALGELNKVLQAKPGYPKAYYLKGSIYSYLQQYEDALESYNKALDTEITNPHLHYDIANTFSRLHDEQAAILELKTALKLEPNNPDYLYSLCSAYHRIQKFQLALNYCGKALEQVRDPQERNRITDLMENLRLLKNMSSN